MIVGSLLIQLHVCVMYQMDVGHQETIKVKLSGHGIHDFSVIIIFHVLTGVKKEASN